MLVDLGVNPLPVRGFRSQWIYTQFDQSNSTGRMPLTLPSLAGVAALKSLITLYINICKITFFPSTQFTYIYVSIFICMLCYKDQLGDFTYIYV